MPAADAGKLRAVYGTVVHVYVPAYCARDRRLMVLVWLAWVKLVTTSCAP